MIVALTVALVLITVWYGWTTWGLMRQSACSQQLASQPIVVFAEAHPLPNQSQDGFPFVVSLRNAGGGPALDVQLTPVGPALIALEINDPTPRSLGPGMAYEAEIRQTFQAGASLQQQAGEAYRQYKREQQEGKAPMPDELPMGRLRVTYRNLAGATFSGTAELAWDANGYRITKTTIAEPQCNLPSKWRIWQIP